MKKPSILKPARVDRAQERLERAIDRLEAAIEGRTEAIAQANELSHRVGGIEGENEQLRQLTTEVSDRLDAAIVRMRAIVGG